MTKTTALELLKAISKIEGYLISIAGLKRPDIVYDNIDIIVEGLMKELEDKEQGR